MLFNSGFGGAFGIMAGLLRRGDVAVLDERCHICWLEGVKAAGARAEFFAHNDVDALEAALKRHADKRRVVVVEGIYSMDGDMADLANLIPMAQRHGVGTIIDEAHSILTTGRSGRGTTEYFDIEDGIVLKYGTFSKAFAGIGGFVSGPEATIRYLRFYANSYSFSCSLPPATVAALTTALKVAQSEPKRRKTLQDNATYFRQQLNSLGFNTGSSMTQVIPIILGSNRRRLYEYGHALRDRGLFLAPIDYPSVKENELRFRASVTSDHDRNTLDEALCILADTIPTP
jgi:glycine C-acetyltransferase